MCFLVAMSSVVAASDDVAAGCVKKENVDEPRNKMDDVSDVICIV